MDDRIAILGLNLVDGLGPVRISMLLSFFGSFSAIWEANAGDLLQVQGIGERIAMSFSKVKREGLLDRELELLEKEKVSFVTIIDEGYPSLLRSIRNPPPVLYFRGVLKEAESIAIVGTRRPTQYGRRIAREFARELALSGFCVVSGLARGIDSEAHRGALEGEGLTYAVLGSGLLRIYPPEMKGLAEEIAENGALISEYPLLTPPLSQNFPRRNRIISGLSRGVLVVEAPVKSGAMITVSYALDQGRDVFAVPGSIYSPQSEGPNLLIQQGAKPVMTAGDLMEEYGVRKAFSGKSYNNLDISEEERRFLDKLPVGEVFSIDSLIYNDDSYGNFAIITLLDLKGYIRRVEGGKIVRIK